ncbi:MAG: redox-sensing transcriptional repressor Rex [Clostridia bacterium]|nr:redox-sensing transcriptional repressor Rex [Clostridia bacterium]
MEISIATLERLPQYLRILKIKKEEGIINISSTTIAGELGLNSIQVRKDLAIVSKNDGKPGIGFEVEELIKDIEEFLDLNNTKEVIIVGAGRLGQALMNYKEFDNDISIVMAFDKDKEKCNNKNIFFIEEMEKLVKKKHIHIGIITVPKEEAQNVCDMMIKSNIKIIWNFAPINLKVPQGVVVKNEDLSASLSVLLKGIELKVVKENKK